MDENLLKRTYSELQEQWSFNLQPKQQLFAKLKQKKLNLFSKKMENKQKAVQAKKSVR